MFPEFGVFSEVCKHGLSVVRPLDDQLGRERDREGWNYESASVPSYQAYGRLRALVTLNAARELRPRRVLEVAAGDAALSACLAQDGAEVVVNDLRSHELQESVGTFTNSELIRIVPGDLFSLDPASIGRFDLVVACEVLEHVAHPADLLAHLRSFLTRGGSLILSTPNGEYFRNRLLTYSQIDNPSDLEVDQFKPDADGHLFLITTKELHRMAMDSGLSVQSVFLWASPFITGHAGARLLSHFVPLRLLYNLEETIGKSRAASRLCYSILAVLQADNSQ